MNLIFRLFIGIFCFLSVKTYSQNNMERAVQLLENGKVSEAEKIFEENDHDLKAIEYLGDISSFQKEWDDAIDYYEELVEAREDNAMYNFKLGGALGMKAYYGNKFTAALLIGDVKKYLKKSADLDANHAEARRALVELYMQLPSIIGGSETIAKSYASDLRRINELDALLADGYIYKIKEYKDLASNKYDEALRLAKNKPSLITRNYLKYELGEVAALYDIHAEAGKKFLQEYIQDYGYKDIKTPAWAYLRLAQIERNEENTDMAKMYINNALEIDPSFDKALEEKEKIEQL